MPSMVVPVINARVQDLPLVAGLLAPLLTTSALHLPQLTALGIAAQLYLTRITVNKPSCPVSEAAETKTLGAHMKSLVITSDANRATRGVLGAVHVVAAVAMGGRGSSVQDTSGAGVFALWLLLNVVGLLALLVVGLTWFSSGYYGQ